MKKVFAIALALTLVLSISAVAFAAGSPTGGGSSSNVPVDVTEIVYGPASAVDKPIVRVVDKDGTEVTKITAEQEKQVDAVIDDAIKSGNAVVEAIYVDAPEGTSEANPVTVIIELKSGEKVLIYSVDGSLQQTVLPEDLAHVEGDFYEVTIPASCILVIAKQ